jgi:hypothetical protein
MTEYVEQKSSDTSTVLASISRKCAERRMTCNTQSKDARRPSRWRSAPCDDDSDRGDDWDSPKLCVC